MMRKRLLKAVTRCTMSVWKTLDAQGKKDQILAVTPYNYLNTFGISSADIELGNKSLVIEIMGAYSEIGFVFEKDGNLFTAKVENGIASFEPFEHDALPASIIAYGNKLEELNGITSFAESGSAKLMAGCSAKGVLPELNVYTSSVEEVDIEDPEQPVNLDDKDRDFVIKGTASKGITVAASASTTLKDVTMTSDSRLNVTSMGAITESNMMVEGTFTKNKGNAQQVLNAETISISDSTFAANGYNAIEAGMSSRPSEINIKGVDFTGALANNAISIFDTADNAVINIEDCVFDNVFNPIRISNKSNAHLTINIKNCECKKWESDLQYTGMILFQDYTSTSAEAAVTNNLFAPEKVHVNVVSFKLPNGEMLQAPENMATICGSGTADQVFYVYADKGGLVAYDAARYPLITIA